MSWATYCMETRDEEGVREQDKTRLEEQGWQGVIVERIERMRNKNRVMRKKRENVSYFSSDFYNYLFNSIFLWTNWVTGWNFGPELSTQTARPEIWLYAQQQQNTLDLRNKSRHTIQYVLIRNMMRDENEVPRLIHKSNWLHNKYWSQISRKALLEKCFCSNSGGQHWKMILNANKKMQLTI